MGAHNIQENEETQVKVSTKQFATHEDWDTQTIKNDICWVKLPQQVEMSKTHI